MKIGFLIIVLFCLNNSSSREELIVWDAENKLVWNNFKAAPNYTTEAAAITASGISYDLSAKLFENEIEVDCKVHAYFYPQKSWFKEELKNNEILAHEQLHFDITAFFASKLRKQIAKKKFTKKVKREVKELFIRINKELDSAQTFYDFETNFSRNKIKQELWQLKIDKLLEKK